MPRQGPFPSKEAELNNYFQAAFAHIMLNKIRLKISQEDQDQLNILIADWNIKYPLSQNENTRTKVTVKDKDDAKDKLINHLRKIYADIPASILTNQDRINLNLLERDSTRTPPAVPTSKPIVLVSTQNRLEHTIYFAGSEGSNAKPHGARGCQIWFKIGDPVVETSELSYMATPTASPYLYHFNGKDAGKIVHYWLRWENTRGEVGPWSDVITTTIVG